MTEVMEKSKFKPFFCFVYGTLKSGYWNNRILGDSTLVGTAITEGDEYILTDCGFPYLIPRFIIPEEDRNIFEEHYNKVIGEVYSIESEQVAESLDSLEGVSSGHYQKIPIIVNDGQKILNCKTYIPTKNTMRRALNLPVCEVVDINRFGEAYMWGNKND